MVEMAAAEGGPVKGPIASVRSKRAHEVSYTGAAAPLREVWVALRTNMRAVLESVTLADIARNDLPADVLRLAAEPQRRRLCTYSFQARIAAPLNSLGRLGNIFACGIPRSSSCCLTSC